MTYEFKHPFMANLAYPVFCELWNGIRSAQRPEQFLKCCDERRPGWGHCGRRYGTHVCIMLCGWIRHGHVYDHCGERTSSQRAGPHSSTIWPEFRGRSLYRCPSCVLPRREYGIRLAPTHWWADTARVVLRYGKAVTGGQNGESIEVPFIWLYRYFELAFEHLL